VSTDLVTRSLAVALIALAGCGSPAPTVPCMNVAQGDLPAQAAAYRVDVYGADVHCLGNDVPPGAGAHTTADFAATGTIHLDVPPGPHTVVLTAFADAAAMLALGSGCTETTFSPGAQVCLDITLAASPDLGMSEPPDLGVADLAIVDLRPSIDLLGPACASEDDCGADAGTPGRPHCDLVTHSCVMCRNGGDCAAGASCCDGTCQNTSGDPLHCGGCNVVCGTANTSSVDCTSGVCVPHCLANFQDCNGPQDGCEQNIYDINHCGSCSNVCNLPNATASCPTGSCKVAACVGAALDCNANPIDGCECASGTACCGNACQFKHMDGLGDFYYDCVPLGTYDAVQAGKAATAWDPAGTQITNMFSDSKGTVSYVCNQSTSHSSCACWQYAASGQYTPAAIGHVALYGPKANSCFVNPGGSGPNWN
jgi:hypothetical protein